jgi:hypothetical protein
MLVASAAVLFLALYFSIRLAVETAATLTVGRGTISMIGALLVAFLWSAFYLLVRW